MPLIQSGKLRGLAVNSSRRVPGIDLPTMVEAAHIPEFDTATVWGVFLPAGAPQHIVARLESWFDEIGKMESTKQFLANKYADSFQGGARELAEFLPKKNQERGGTAQAREN